MNEQIGTHESQTSAAMPSQTTQSHTYCGVTAARHRRPELGFNLYRLVLPGELRELWITEHEMESVVGLLIRVWDPPSEADRLEDEDRSLTEHINGPDRRGEAA